MINIATVFGDEVEKLWSPHVPRECVFQLRLMAEQLMDMEKAIKTQQTMIEKLMKFAVLEGNALRELKQLRKDFDRRFNQGPTTEPVDETEH